MRYMLLITNVDDVSGEVVPDIIEGLMALGAGSAHVIPALTKKGRAELIFMVDVKPEKAEELAGYLSQELGTIGVRALETRHFHFDYRFKRVRVEYLVPKRTHKAEVRVKLRFDKEQNPAGAKADHDDLSVIISWFANDKPHPSFKSLKILIEQAAVLDQPIILGDLKIVTIKEDIHEKSTASTG
jgi:uncharacterized protein (DUF111 family)